MPTQAYSVRVMGTRARRVFGEAVKFSAVNVVATAVAVVLFNALVHGLPGLYGPGPLHHYPVISYFVANTIGMLISFYGSRRYAFKHRRPTGPGGGLLNYTLVNFASFVIPMVCLWVTRNVLEWSSVLADNLSANVIGAVLATMFRFWAFRRFVFKRHVVEFHGAHGAKVFGSGRPELGPDETELLEHQAQQRQADAHDVVGVAGHARHEGPAESVQGEGSRHR
jgi:putative flippase GtrA